MSRRERRQEESGFHPERTGTAMLTFDAAPSHLALDREGNRRTSSRGRQPQTGGLKQGRTSHSPAKGGAGLVPQPMRRQKRAHVTKLG